MKKRYKFLTLEQTSKLFKTIEKEGSIRDLAIFNIAYFFGLRASEIGLLKIGNISASKRSIYIPRVKRGLEYTQSLDDKRKKCLFKYLETREDKYDIEAPLFLSRKNQPIGRNMLYQLMKSYARKARLPEWISDSSKSDSYKNSGFHVLRHSIAVHLLEAELSIDYIQARLGHVNINNTMEYISLTDKVHANHHRKIMQKQHCFA